MLIRGLGSHATAGRAHQESLLDEEGLEYVFDGAALFADGCRQAVHPDRAAVEFSITV